MTSKLKIYKTEITPELNGVFDSLSTYLGSLTPTVSIDDFQYQQIDLDIFIRIKKNQSNVGDNDIGNYAVIEQDGKKYYYFVLDANWTAEETVTLQLSIDSLNTFNGDYEISDKTQILRQHKDRYEPTTLVENATLTLDKVIDRVNEGFSGIVTERASKVGINDESYSNQHWYLVYSSESTNDPITVDLYAENDTTPYIGGYSPSEELTWESMQSGVYYYFIKDDNPGGQFNFGQPGGGHETWNFTKPIMNYHYAYVFSKDDVEPYIHMDIITSFLTGGLRFIEAEEQVTSSIPLVFTTSDQLIIYPTKTVHLNKVVQEGIVEEIKTSQEATKYLKSIKILDRSVSKLSQIIELPYAPDNFTWTGQMMNYDTNKWKMNNGVLRLKDYTEEFENEITTKSFSSLLTNTIPITTKASFFNYSRNWIENTMGIKDSKLLNSEFFTYKLVYDCDSKEIKLERLNRNLMHTSPSYTVNFKQSNTLSNQMAFKWSFTNGTYNNEEDVGNILVTAKDNSLMLYNNAWLNYIRSGKKWDVVSNAVSLGATAISTGTGIYSTIKITKTATVSAGLIAVSKASTVAGIVTTVASGIASAANTVTQILQKREEAKLQAPTTSGNSSIDVFDYYNGNKLYIIQYKPIQEMIEKLSDLFHYCGYAVDKQGIPNMTSRYWFNFCQANIEFKNETNKPVWDRFKKDMKARWAKGVTQFHYHNGYDFLREKENWESFLNE